MLVLTRKENESIIIGNSVKITIIRCEDGKVKLGIEAPDDVKIHREEVLNMVKEENKLAASAKNRNMEQWKNIKL